MVGPSYVNRSLSIVCFVSLPCTCTACMQKGPGKERQVGDLFVCAFRMGAAACFKRARLKDYSEKTGHKQSLDGARSEMKRMKRMKVGDGGKEI